MLKLVFDKLKVIIKRTESHQKCLELSELDRCAVNKVQHISGENGRKRVGLRLIITLAVNQQ